MKMNNMKIKIKTVHLFIAIIGLQMQANSQDIIDASTLNNKVMAGYQGWFAAEGDGSGVGWRHWGRGSNKPGPDAVTIDYWPDMREYEADELFNTNFTYPEGSNAGLYSAYTPKTVDRHVKWMKDYGIDGVFVQRFIGNTLTILELRDQVLQNVRFSSEKYGRVFANMYDVSGGNPATIVENIIDDWKHLVDDLKITESPNYLYHKGRPLLSIWGLGHREEFTANQARQIIKWLTEDAPERYLVTLKGGIDNKWQSHSSEWQEIYESFDVISPWAVGRYKDNVGADNFRQTYIEPDLAKTQSKNIDYMPVVFPGFSWFNNKPFKDDGVTPNVLNATPRNGGNFFWHQIYNAIDAGCNMVYVAMFDEVDEGTAIYKLAENTDQTPVETAFVTLDMDGYDLPSDWYLRLTGEGSKMLRGEIAISQNMPINPTVSNAKFISQNVPTIMSPGTGASVSITLQNTGKTNWTKDDGFYLGSQNTQKNTTWGFDRIDFEEGETITPGASKTFAFDIIVPNDEGVYNFQWRMMQEGVNWFGDISPNRLVNVTDNPVFLDDCDALTDWNSSASLELNDTEKKQGVSCIEFNGSNTDEFSKAFSTAYNSSISANNAVLQFWYYVSDVSKLEAQNKVELGSAGKADENIYYWSMPDLVTGWNLISLKVKDAAINGEPDLNEINWLSIKNDKNDLITTRIDEIQVLDINANAEKFLLKVNSGRGSGNYIFNEVFEIIADDAPSGYIFEKWAVNSGTPYISNVNAKNTLLRMPNSEVEVTATYRLTLNYLDDCDDDLDWNDANAITLITTGHKQGTGCLEYYGGGPEESSREFYKTFPNPYNTGVSESNGILQFWYYISDASKIGTSNQIELGSAGKFDVDEYNWKLNGIVNTGWNLLNLKFSEAGKKGIPDLSAINWFRLYDKKSGPVTSRIDGIKILSSENLNKYSLFVDSGSGSGIYYADEEVIITANTAPENMKFDSWFINAGDAVISDTSAESTTLVMPAMDVSVSATYKNITTGIHPSNTNEAHLNIYPNPSAGIFHIELPSYSSQVKFEVFNTLGNMLQDGYLKSNSSSIRILNSSKGTYILRLITEKTVYKELLILK